MAQTKQRTVLPRTASTPLIDANQPALGEEALGQLAPGDPQPLGDPRPYRRAGRLRPHVP